jgi:hypothetical protein
VPCRIKAIRLLCYPPAAGSQPADFFLHSRGGDALPFPCNRKASPIRSGRTASISRRRRRRLGKPVTMSVPGAVSGKPIAGRSSFNQAQHVVGVQPPCNVTHIAR